MLAARHPEWRATLEYRHGQVVIEAADEAAMLAARKWLDGLDRGYVTGNQSHLYGASHRSNLPRDVGDERRALDADEPTVKNRDYRGEVPEKMDRG